MDPKKALQISTASQRLGEGSAPYVASATARLQSVSLSPPAIVLPARHTMMITVYVVANAALSSSPANAWHMADTAATARNRFCRAVGPPDSWSAFWISDCHDPLSGSRQVWCPSRCPQSNSCAFGRPGTSRGSVRHGFRRVSLPTFASYGTFSRSSRVSGCVCRGFAVPPSFGGLARSPFRPFRSQMVPFRIPSSPRFESCTCFAFRSFVGLCSFLSCTRPRSPRPT